MENTSPASRGAPAVQDAYPDEFAHCYGCGRLNARGLHIRSFVEGPDVVTSITPRPEHTSFPGFVYGGFIASVLDCHLIAGAAAARVAGGRPMAPFVTARLHVEYVKPTPIGGRLDVRARADADGPRKFSVTGELACEGTVRARGELVAVEMPASMAGHGRAP